MKFIRRFAALFRRNQIEAEMAEEMRLHLEQREQEAVERGMNAEDARLAAARRFGGVEQAKERCRDEHRRGVSWLEHFVRDVRVSARALRKDKVYFGIAVLVLALGIGGVTAQFSVINSALIRGLPFPEAERLVRISVRDPAWGPNARGNLLVRDLVEWSRGQQSLEGLAGFHQQGSFILTVRDVPQRFAGAHVTGPLFALLGVKPALGRDFHADDDRLEAPRVTILSDALWRAEFGGDPAVVGRTVRLNGRAATVVGVMPPGFNFPRDQLWMPFFNEHTRPAGEQAGGSIFAVGRLKAGVSLDQAAAELTGFARRAAEQYPKSNRVLTEAVVDPLARAFVSRDARDGMMVMFIAVLAVLLIACLNVMNMQFARATLRAKELAVRGALGASRGRLVAQMLTESMLVAAAGGAAGVLVSAWALKLYTANATGLPPWMTFELDPRVLGFTVAAAGVSVLVAGLLPALVASRTDALGVLKMGGRGHTSALVNRVMSALVVGQIALTAALLVASLVLVKAVGSRYALNFGFDLDAVVVGRINFAADYKTGERMVAAQRQVLERLRSSPQVAQAAFSTRRNGLMTADRRAVLLDRAEQPETQAWCEHVSDGYFAALGLRPLEGREFGPLDTAARPPAALVNATFARKHFPGGSPVGQRLRLQATDERGCTIVGVVPDTQMQGALDARADGAGIFLSALAHPQGQISLVVRPRAAGVASLADGLRREIQAVNPHLAIYAVETPRAALRTALAEVRAVTQLFGVFGVVAVVLSGVGLYGVAAFSVSQRTQEWGIRMALGAAPRQITGMILRQGARRLMIGGTLGLATAFGLARVVSTSGAGVLYNVSPSDPTVYAVVVALLAFATLAACLVPARRATKVDPMVALRAE